ncbi:TetR/AcrR family transcriptional regulator [Fodinibius sp. SL11]|uniref:TetR/AcrR family transcriptional regulator n=1 Tax=Fodinibius sp. SL11 TaxID=3425690 RepID=UPI003F8809C3
MSEELQTEEQILEAAKQIFQERGFAGARMQEIADEAGINKSMLHYYFRSKDKLFQQVFQESIRQFFPEILQVLNADLALVPKIEKLVETYYEMFREQPHLPRFVIHEMNQHPDRFKNFVTKEGFKMPEQFIKQIRAEVEAGTMQKIDPREFIINTIGLCVFPLIARPMIETVFEMNDEQYQQFLEQRKKELPKFILNAVKK